MGLLSFIYSVLGYNLCATLFIAYLMFDYVLGALATFGARYVMESKSGGAYDFYIRWIRVDYGWTELTLTIGPITFKNPKKFKMTPFLIKIDRISCRVNPRSFLDWVKKKRPMEVENVEIERMRLHMERDGKGEMNCWAALGMDAAAGEAAYADAQKSSDKQEQDPEAFEDEGKDEFKGMEKKEKKKAKKSKREKEDEYQLESEKSKSWRNQRRAFLACADNDDDRWLIYLKRAREGDPEALAYIETLDEAEQEWNPEWEPTPLAEQEEWFRFAKKQRCS